MENNNVFTKFTDWVSYAMGTPFNIFMWIVAVGVWIFLFAANIFTSNTNVLPEWFTSNAFNFPLNTVTTLAELYIGFLVAAAANRSERANKKLSGENYELTQKIEKLLEQQEMTLKLLVDYQEKELAQLNNDAEIILKENEILKEENQILKEQRQLHEEIQQ